MGWLILICLILLIVFAVYVTGKSKQENDINQGIVYDESDILYIGGLSNQAGGKKTRLTLKNGYLILDKITAISKENLIKSEIKTEQQITNDINLGKLIVFGLLSFGMKKSKTIIKNYVVIEFNKDESKNNIILESNKPEELVRKINAFVA